MANVSTAPVLNPTVTPEGTVTQSPNLISAMVRPNGTAVLTTSIGKVYAYHVGLQVWQEIYDANSEFNKISGFNEIEGYISRAEEAAHAEQEELAGALDGDFGEDELEQRSRSAARLVQRNAGTSKGPLEILQQMASWARKSLAAYFEGTSGKLSTAIWSILGAPRDTLANVKDTAGILEALARADKKACKIITLAYLEVGLRDYVYCPRRVATDDHSFYRIKSMQPDYWVPR